MVQNINVQNQNNYGTVNRVGTTENGRGVYQISDVTGRVAGRVSVAAQDCDKFEKSYQAMMEAAPKLQQFAESTTPEEMKKKQKKAGWGAAIITAIGAGTAIWFTRNKSFGKQALATIGGTIAGLTVGIWGASKVMTPPGAKELNNAAKTIQSLDIQAM